MKSERVPQTDRRPARPGPGALDSAFRILSRRDHTRCELALKLGQRGFDRTDVEAALARCRELGYLDDAKTAMTMAGHLAAKGYGPLRIRQVLGQKGVDDVLIEKALTRWGDEKIQVAGARRMLAKKACRLDREGDPWKRRQIAFRYLAGRGFSSTVINRIINDI